jgi:salicylate 5-hydroxylase small subunit
VLDEESGRITAQTHYAIFRTKPGDASEVYNVGRYLDEIARTPEGLRFASRLCVYDSEMVLNSLIYPI